MGARKINPRKTPSGNSPSLNKETFNEELIATDADGNREFASKDS